MARARHFILAFAVILVATTSATASQPASDDAAVYEAALRYLFAHNDSVARDDAVAYYVSIGGEDPSVEFLGRFKDHKPPVRSESMMPKGDPESLGGAVAFGVEILSRPSPDIIRIRASYYEASESAAAYLYEMKRTASGWHVTKSTQEWIS